MLGFSLGFLAPFLAAAAGFAPAGLTKLVIAALAMGVAAWRYRPALPSTALGACLAIAVPTPQAPQALARMVAPVRFEGVVDRTVRRDDGSVLIHLRDRWRIVWQRASQWPLGGDRVSGFGRFDPEDQAIFAAEESLIVTPPGGLSLEGRIEVLRRRLSDRLGQGLSPQTAAIARGLVLGEGSLDAAFRQQLADTGALHFFSVSGFHVALLAGLLARRLGPRSPALIALVTGYGFLTGMRAPAGRAVLLASYFVLARLCARTPSPGAILAFAAAAWLAVDPMLYFDIGFQLSFSAYAGIVWLALPWLARTNADLVAPSLAERAWRAIQSGIAVTVGAQLMSLPIQIAHFHTTSGSAIPASLALAPLMAPLFLVGAAVMAWPEIPFGRLLLEGLAETLIAIVDVLDRWPGTPFVVGAPSAWAIALAAGGALGAAWLLTKVVPRRRSQVMALALMAAVPLHVPTPTIGPAIELLEAGSGRALLVRPHDDLPAELYAEAAAERRLRSALIARGFGTPLPRRVPALEGQVLPTGAGQMALLGRGVVVDGSIGPQGLAVAVLHPFESDAASLAQTLLALAPRAVFGPGARGRVAPEIAALSAWLDVILERPSAGPAIAAEPSR